MKQRLSVAELQPGMFVSELDRPWVDTPYLLQGLLIESKDDIDELSKFCSYVYVDPLKSSDTARAVIARAAAPLPLTIDTRGKRTPFHGKTHYRDSLPVEEELPAARDGYEQAADVVSEMARTMSTELRVDYAAAKESVGGLRESIIRNPDALLLITKMRKTRSIEYQRAIDISVYLLAFGRELELPEEDLSTLGIGGLLLDIGKLHLPEELLEKETTYTPAEFRLMKRHVYYGESIVRKNQSVPEGVIRMIAEHHERENGSGYPNGLVGDQISAFGRMAAIVDCYMEMVTPRNRSIHVSPQDALEMLHNWGGQQFHPALVETFIQCVGVFPVGSLVELNTGEVGIVLAHRRGQRLRPRLLLMTDPKKLRFPTPRTLDLMDTPANDFGVQYQIGRGLESGMYGINLDDIDLQS